jgi:exodeoxyribonuclease V gamma subunit
MPVVDLDVEELDDILRLLAIIDAVSEVAQETTASCTAAEWALLLGRAMERLCGTDSQFARVAAMELGKLARIDVEGQTMIDFSDVERYLQAQFTVVPEATYRRDGQILVTNMASQHLVPHRMVCIVGLDDGSLPTGAVDGNDLTGRQAVEGDPDPRHDVRRQILNVIMSSTEQVVLVCDGRSSKNNQDLPRVTPLHELLDYSTLFGVTIRER